MLDINRSWYWRRLSLDICGGFDGMFAVGLAICAYPWTHATLHLGFWSVTVGVEAKARE